MTKAEDKSPRLRDVAEALANKLDVAPHQHSTKSRIAHLTPGEIVIPESLLTAEVMTVLRTEARKRGVDLSRLVVGNARNSINPRTGQPEFFDPSDEPTEEITITAPPETRVCGVAARSTQ